MNSTRLTARRRVANFVANMKIGIARKLAGSRIGRTRQRRASHGDRDLGTTIQWQRTPKGYFGHAASGEIYVIQPELTAGHTTHGLRWSLRSAFGPRWDAYSSTHKAMLGAEAIEARKRHSHRGGRPTSRSFGGPE